MSRISLSAVLMLICCYVESQAIEIDACNIRGIEISYTGIVFDANQTRKQYACFQNGKSSIIESKSDIDYFCALFDSLEYIFPTFNNPYSGCSKIYNIPRGSKFFNILPQIGEDVDGFAKIFYKNGRLPELIWFSQNVEIAGNLYRMPTGVMDKLYDFVKSKPVVSNASEIITAWQSEPTDCTSISAAGVWTLPDGIKLSRSEFVDNIRLGNDGFNGLLYAKIDRIPDLMNAIDELKFRRNLSYDTYTPAMQSYVAKNGELIWTDISDPVIALIIIHRKDEKSPELIWITESGVDRDYSSFYRSDKLDQILKISHLCP